MFQGTKGIVTQHLNIDNIIATLQILDYSPELKQYYMDTQPPFQGDAIITINDEKDGKRELFILWNYNDFQFLHESDMNTTFNLALWGNSKDIISNIVSEMGGGILLENDKKRNWNVIESNLTFESN
jgi:hypothetical protein